MSTNKKTSRGVKKTQQELLEAMYNIKLGDQGKEKKHEFWNTQPMPQTDEETKIAIGKSGPIEKKTVDEVQKEPLNLPSHFTWSDCDLNDPSQLDEIYNLLTQNYVEDDDNMFRFDYSRDFLRWALTPPGYSKSLHVGVRVKKSNKLVGFITGIPAHVHVYTKNVPMVEINFLCVHKKLRSKRLAPVLIKEITRRVNCTNVWQAVYTAGVVLPKPVARNRYWHRSLNPKKLIDVGFSRLREKMTIARTIKLYSVPKETSTPGLRPLKESDCPQARKLLNAYLRQFDLRQDYSLEEFKHWFIPRKGVIFTYVVEENNKITDMISFYSLPSHIIGHPKHQTLNAAYSFYNVAKKTSWKDLMTDALTLAKQADFDVFNALDVMENATFLEELKFGIGDGNLQYYVYNWRCPEMQPGRVGLVLM